MGACNLMVCPIHACLQALLGGSATAQWDVSTVQLALTGLRHTGLGQTMLAVTKPPVPLATLEDTAAARIWLEADDLGRGDVAALAQQYCSVAVAHTETNTLAADKLELLVDVLDLFAVYCLPTGDPFADDIHAALVNPAQTAGRLPETAFSRYVRLAEDHRDVVLYPRDAAGSAGDNVTNSGRGGTGGTDRPAENGCGGPGLSSSSSSSKASNASSAVLHGRMEVESRRRIMQWLTTRPGGNCGEYGPALELLCSRDGVLDSGLVLTIFQAFPSSVLPPPHVV